MGAEPTGELATILTGAAYAPVHDRACLRITGADATRWLNGMVTNSVQALAPGEGAYNFVLNAQGRIQGDCTIYREPTTEEAAYLLQTDTAQIQGLQELLDRFIIMDDVELTSLNSHGPDLLFLGPDAAKVFRETADPFLNEAVSNLGPLQVRSSGTRLERVTTPFPGLVPQFLLTVDGTSQELDLHPVAAEVTQVSPEALEQLRILEARPRFGTDIRDRDLPQETNQPQALHFAKGCYVGQEIVERIRSRGQVHRLFTPFRLEGTLPASFPAPLEANGKPAGELTSAIAVPTTVGPVHLALGYARREFLETGAGFGYPGGAAHPRKPGSFT